MPSCTCERMCASACVHVCLSAVGVRVCICVKGHRVVTAPGVIFVDADFKAYSIRARVFPSL